MTLNRIFTLFIICTCGFAQIKEGQIYYGAKLITQSGQTLKTNQLYMHDSTIVIKAVLKEKSIELSEVSQILVPHSSLAPKGVGGLLGVVLAKIVLDSQVGVNTTRRDINTDPSRPPIYAYTDDKTGPTNVDFILFSLVGFIAGWEISKNVFKTWESIYMDPHFNSIDETGAKGLK